MLPIEQWITNAVIGRPVNDLLRVGTVKGGRGQVWLDWAWD